MNLISSYVYADRVPAAACKFKSRRKLWTYCHNGQPKRPAVDLTRCTQNRIYLSRQPVEGLSSENVQRQLKPRQTITKAEQALKWSRTLSQEARQPLSRQAEARQPLSRQALKSELEAPSKPAYLVSCGDQDIIYFHKHGINCTGRWWRVEAVCRRSRWSRLICHFLGSHVMEAAESE